MRLFLVTFLQGDVASQWVLASDYRSGRGVTRNPAASAEWARRAAKQGHAKAQNLLGVCSVRPGIIHVRFSFGISFQILVPPPLHAEASLCLDLA